MDHLIPLEEVCHLFGISKPVAMRKANLGCLPVPAFRLAGTRKGPMYVTRESLESHIQKVAEKATKLNQQMKSAGLV